MIKVEHIVLTGGHAGTTAIAFIQKAKRLNKNWKFFFIGAKSSFEGKDVPTLESKTLPMLNVKFIPIFTGRIQRKLTIWTIPSIFKIPVGFFHAFLILFKIKPKVVLSFGGFSAFPVVVAAYLLRVPIIIHEQTAVVGRANRFSSFFAKRIALARRTSIPFFDRKKIVITGNPISENVVSLKPKLKIGIPPTLLIVGGKSGSVTINDIIEKSLRKLLLKFNVNHQTGIYQYKKFLAVRNKLSVREKRRYKVFSIINPLKMSKYLQSCDILISRAGANIVSEAIAAKIPSIFIPLPFSYLDEQTKNALFAKKYKIAEILEQKSLNPESLYRLILKVRKNWVSTKKASLKLKSPDLNASENLVNLVEEYMQ